MPRQEPEREPRPDEAPDGAPPPAPPERRRRWRFGSDGWISDPDDDGFVLA